MMQPEHNRLRVLHAPGHGPSMTHRTIRYALSSEFRACAVGFSEAYRHEAFIRDRPSWRVTMPVIRDEDDWDRRRGKGDTPVLVRRHHPLIASWSQQASRRSHPVKIAPPRWFNGQTFAHELGVVEVVAAHPNAAVVDVPEFVDRVQQYVASMRVLEAHIRESKRKGRLVVVVGDLNYPVSDDDPPDWSPGPMFDRLNLHTWAVGVDWMAWSWGLVPVGRRIVGRESTGMDHPWLWQEFEGFRRG